MTAAIAGMRSKIARPGALLFNRRLTDTTGGNISVRVNNVICVTPLYTGSKFRWYLRPDQVFVADVVGNELEGEGGNLAGGEGPLQLLNESPNGRAVVHAYAQHARPSA